MQGIVQGMPVAVMLSGLTAGLVMWAVARWPMWRRRRSGTKRR